MNPLLDRIPNPREGGPVVARVFPRRTNATPTDALAFYDDPPLWMVECDAVHVSVAFTYDMERAALLAAAWKRVAPVSIGGPGAGMRGEEFVPGRYMAPGFTITSRGCPNKCWFCSVWKRDGALRELPISDGWIVNDDNILACSTAHLQRVGTMLARQPKRPEFRGGLEAARLTDWHVHWLCGLRPSVMWFAYDAPDDYEPLVVALRKFKGTDLYTRHRLRCFVLIGSPKDTLDAAEKRLRQVVALGAFPMAMLWRDDRGRVREDWRTFNRLWARPAIIAMMTRTA